MKSSLDSGKVILHTWH